MPPQSVNLDFETASCVDLRRVGAFRYAEDKTTRPLCLAYQTEAMPKPAIWLPGQPAPDWVAAAARGEVLLRAFNAQFEWAVLNYCMARPEHGGWPAVPISAMRCTLAQARYWGYGGRLAETARTLGVADKDAAGHRLMLQMCRPRDAAALTWWHEDDPEKYARLQDYCLQDVVVERQIARKLPPLPDQEQIVFEHDMAINAEGIRADIELIDRLDAAVEREAKRLDGRMSELTFGELKTTRAVAKIREWVLNWGVAGTPDPTLTQALPDLTKDTVALALARKDLDPLVRAVLTTRQTAAKTSVKKLPAMRAARCADGRIRGLLQYYGAARTGRWAGRIVQPQNLPRGELPKDCDAAAIADVIASGWETPEALAKELHVSPMVLASGLIRACLIPDDYETGGMFLAPDYGQIEARVIAWLAGQLDIVEVFRRGDDVYVYTAAQQGSADRQYGKVCVLGLGFGMGPPKFRDTAAKSKVALDLRQSERAVYGWRDANKHIVAFWYALDRTARDLLQDVAHNPSRGRFSGFERAVPGADGKVSMRIAASVHAPDRDWTLAIRLPNKRELVYPGFGFRPHPHRIGEDALSFLGVDQTTGQWGVVYTYGGKLAENVTQAVARDVMAAAIVRLRRAGYRACLTVHDEIVVDLARDRCTPGRLPREIETVENIMLFRERTPRWLAGLPLAVEATPMRRYRK